MLVRVVADYEELSRTAARFVAREILLKEDAVLALSTGDTPLGMYRELIRLNKEGVISFSMVTTFNIDEYVGLAPSHPQSFHYYMKTNLLNHVDIRPELVHIPNGVSADLEEECRRYEEEIARHGGIDLMVLGIGINGHIGFNEPGSDWGTTTRVVTLSEETRRRYAKRFGGLDLVPIQAITMGIKTIMNAKKILLIASGEEKARIIREALCGPVTQLIPASVLQLHPEVTIILDRDAAALLHQHPLYFIKTESLV